MVFAAEAAIGLAIMVSLFQEQRDIERGRDKSDEVVGRDLKRQLKKKIFLICAFFVFICGFAFAGVSPSSVSITVAQGLWSVEEVQIFTGSERSTSWYYTRTVSGGDWIKLSSKTNNWPENGTQKYRVPFSTSNLAPGTYTGSIEYSGFGVLCSAYDSRGWCYEWGESGETYESGTIPIALNVVDNTVLSRESISADATQGCGTVSENFTITLPGPGVSLNEMTYQTSEGKLSYAISDDQSWMTVKHNVGFTKYKYFNSTFYLLSVGNTGTVAVDFNTSALVPGTYTGTVTVQSGHMEGSMTGHMSKKIPVTLKVHPSEEICGDGIDNDCDGQIDEDCLKKTLQYVTGDNQEGDILSPLEAPFVVKVVDQNNNPTAGNVTWQVTATSQDAQGQSISTTTGLSTTLTLGDTLGDYQVTTTCTDCTENTIVTFSARASGPKVTLKLEPDEVWPTIPASQKEPSNDNKAKVIAEVMSYNGRPLNGYGVEFKAEADKTSGGHDAGHADGRPFGKFSDNSFCITDNGQCEVKYTASDFGGIETIAAKLQSLRFEHIPSQSKDLTVRVPGLGPLGTNAVWILSGFSGATSYGSCSGTQIRHGDNHYATFSTAIRVAMMAKDYYDELDAKLGINDMSLRSGGLFDICSHWMTGHWFHRIGKSVDIDGAALKINGTSEEVDRDALDEIAQLHGGTKVIEGSIHYEFP